MKKKTNGYNIIKMLKPIEKIRAENPGEWSGIDQPAIMVYSANTRSDDMIEFTSSGYKRSWGINGEMATKFGDGKYYRFKKMILLNDYTHQGDDGWLYSELWFENDDIFSVKNMFSDMDFIL